MKYEDEGLYNIAGYLDEYYNSKEGRTVEETMGLIKTEVLKCFNQHKESLTHEHLLTTKIEERNNKPVKMISGENLLNENDPIKPSHYKTGDKDLFDELYDRLYHSKKMFTGREVFIVVMKFVAERYTRRYPNKNAEDLSKGIYTLERLRGYEEMEE